MVLLNLTPDKYDDWVGCFVAPCNENKVDRTGSRKAKAINLRQNLLAWNFPAYDQPSNRGRFLMMMMMLLLLMK